MWLPLPVLGGIPHILLSGVIIGDGKRHQLVKRDFLLAIQLDEARGYIRQLEPLTHSGRSDAEARGDFFDSGAFIDHQAAKGVKLSYTVFMHSS